MLILPKNRGFSLVELMVTITILVIILAIATPSFSTLLNNYRLRSFAESTLNGIQLARSIAVNRNEAVQFSITTSGSTYGWSIQTEAATGTALQAKSSSETSGHNISLAVVPANATTITFNGTGRVATNIPASSTITAIDVDSTAVTSAQSQDLRIQIMSGGVIKLCDPNVTSSTDVKSCS